MSLSSFPVVCVLAFVLAVTHAGVQEESLRVRVTKSMNVSFAATLFLPRGKCLFIGHWLRAYV